MTPRPLTIDPGPVWVYLVSLGAFFTRFGYNFAAGDQDELVPLLMSHLDPSLFQSDWFVQMQAAEIGVRTYVVWLLIPFSRLVSIPIVLFGMYLICWILVGSGAYRLARKFVSSRSAAAGAVFLSLGVFHKWTLGSNDLVYSMFVGEVVAWAAALHGLRLWLDRKDLPAALLLGIATWFQMLVGLLLAGVILIERLWDRAETRSFAWHRKNDFLAVGTFSLAAMPAVLPVAIQQLDALTTDSELVFYILAPFRNPFHHMISSFGAEEIVRFFVMLCVFVVAGLVLNRRGELGEAKRLFRFTVIVLGSCVVTAIFTELYAVLLIAKFQAYKLSVVLKFLFLVVVCGVAVKLIPSRLERFVDGWLSSGPKSWIASGACLVIVVSLAVAKPSLITPRLGHEVHLDSHLGRMESWIGANTDLDAVFAVPPDNSTFRSNARRAIVVNYPAFPFDDVDMVVWYHRLLDVAPIKPPESGLGIKPVLNDAYHSLSSADWIALQSKYDIDFLLLDESKLTSWHPFEVVRREGNWTLYKLPAR